MAKRFKLRDLEKERGDLHKIIPSLVNQGGQNLAANNLNVSAATIGKWLKDNGYKQIVRYERPEKKEEAS